MGKGMGELLGQMWSLMVYSLIGIWVSQVKTFAKIFTNDTLKTGLF